MYTHTNDTVHCTQSLKLIRLYTAASKINTVYAASNVRALIMYTHTNVRSL